MRGPGALARSRPVREAALLVGVLVVAVLVLRGPAVRQQFSIDESRWIATSRYFWTTILERDVFGPEWQPNYIVLTHPPVARYLIGFGLWLQGWSPEQLNGRYDSLRSMSYNLDAGNVPEPPLLAAARRVTFVFAVAAVGLVYLVGRTLGGPVAGLAAAGSALASPLLSTLWTRALAESILATFTLLALLLALRCLPRLGAAPMQPWLPAATGTALALAAATKLSGGLAVVGLAAYGLTQQLPALVRTRRTAGFRSWLDLGLAAVVVFVAVNPLLYVRPAERAVALVRHRQAEMEFQQSAFSNQAVPADLSERIGRVARRLFATYATPAGPLPLSVDGPLVLLGLAVLARRSWHELRRSRAGPAWLLACWLAGTYVVTTVSLGFDSSHYYAPLATLNTVLIGLGIGAVAPATLNRFRRMLAPAAAAPQKTQTPPMYSGSRTSQTTASAPMATQGAGVLASRSSSQEGPGDPPG